jgi:hypothetical protein
MHYAQLILPLLFIIGANGRKPQHFLLENYYLPATAGRPAVSRV